MEGVNYQFICHHAHTSLGTLIEDLVHFAREEKHPLFDMSFCDKSMHKWRFDYWVQEHVDELVQRAMHIVQRALIFSDAAFLFPPHHIAFAVAAIVSESFHEDGNMSDTLQDFLVTRHPLLTEHELLQFTRNVRRVVSLFLSNPLMDLRPMNDAERMASDMELHRVIYMVGRIKMHQTQDEAIVHTRKRKRRMTCTSFTPPQGPTFPKMAKVTPTRAYH